MSTAGISAAAVAISAANSARITQMKREQCELNMPHFKAAGATAEEARAFASCVDLVYPSQSGPEVVIFFKVVIAIVLVSMLAGVLFGAIRGWKLGMGRIEGALMLGLMWPACAALGILILTGIAFGVRYLVTA